MSARPAGRPFLIALIAAIALAGCGPTPPQAPLEQAKKLDAATSDISTECGLSYQVTAFPGNHVRDLANLEASAIQSAHSLASVEKRNPAWIYQGETVGDVVNDALAMLRACGLNHAATALEHATSHRRG
jgi:ribonuclease PH